MPQLFAILDSGGRTLLVRTQGDIQTPSFPTLGLLCSIATFGSSKGYLVQTFGTDNIQIVYEEFQGHLLFVLATSNKLLSPDLLHCLLQVAYSGVEMWVGRQVLAAAETHGVETLKKALRGMAWIEHLMSHDALLPCTMLAGPQWLGLCPDDLIPLRASLTRVSAALPGTPMAALLREGLYVTTTPQWRDLTPRQQLLLQHMAQHMSPKDPDSPSLCHVHITAPESGESQVSYQLVVLKAGEGSLLLFLCRTDISMSDIHAALDEHAQGMDSLLERPVSTMLPWPHIPSVTYDLAAVVQLTLPDKAQVKLYWGHRRFDGSGGLNPLNSPTVRKRMHGAASAASTTIRALSTSGKGGTSEEALQLFFKACCDLLTAFMLSTPQQQLPVDRGDDQRETGLPDVQEDGSPGPVAGVTGGSGRMARGAAATSPSSSRGWRKGTAASLDRPLSSVMSTTSNVSGAGSEANGTPRTAMAAIAHKFFSSFVSPLSTPRTRTRFSQNTLPQAPETNKVARSCPAVPQQLLESQMTAEGRRLVSLVDPSFEGGVSVFMVCAESQGRANASRAARELRQLCLLPQTTP